MYRCVRPLLCMLPHPTTTPLILSDYYFHFFSRDCLPEISSIIIIIIKRELYFRSRGILYWCNKTRCRRANWVSSCSFFLFLSFYKGSNETRTGFSETVQTLSLFFFSFSISMIVQTAPTPKDKLHPPHLPL